jgi:hypothetical protein
MNPKSWLVRRGGAFALALAALAACDDAAAPTVVEPPPVLGRGIHPLVVLAGSAGDTARVELRLHQVEMKAEVSSFQGELAFDTTRLALAGAEVPEKLMVVWNPVAAGRVRFAGASLDGLGEAPMVVLRFIPSGRVSADLFKLRLEEVVAEEGSFQNLTTQIVARERPLFSAGPLVPGAVPR